MARELEKKLALELEMPLVQELALEKVMARESALPLAQVLVWLLERELAMLLALGLGKL